MVTKRRSNTIAAIGTLVVMLLVFLLLWFIRIYSMREQEDEGIEVAFGVAENGGGYQPIESESSPSASAAPATAATKPSANELMVQEHRHRHHFYFLMGCWMLSWKRKWQPIPVFLPGESMSRGV